MSFNKAIIVGNLGADPELRNTSTGTAVCEMRMATSRKYKDKSGALQEDTQWHRVVVWDKQGEACSNHLTKGSRALVEGRLQTRSWEDKDGNKRFTTEIVAERVVFLSSTADRPATATQDAPPVGDDDIPF